MGGRGREERDEGMNKKKGGLMKLRWLRRLGRLEGAEDSKAG
jgi:hypothetical protein